MIQFKEENLQYEIAIAQIMVGRTPAGPPFISSGWLKRWNCSGYGCGLEPRGVRKIVDVTEHTSELMLITDELASVGARVLPGGYLSIVSGQGAKFPR
jgi:hypothetical protein